MNKTLVYVNAVKWWTCLRLQHDLIVFLTAWPLSASPHLQQALQ